MPHSITGVAPADLMFKHAARNDIPAMTGIALEQELTQKLTEGTLFVNTKSK